MLILQESLTPLEFDTLYKLTKLQNRFALLQDWVVFTTREWRVTKVDFYIVGY